MCRTAVAIAFTLALLTGIVLGQVFSLGSTRSFTVPASQSNARETAQRFYDALNTALESGETADLQSILRDDYIEHSPFDSEIQTAQAVMDNVLALGRAFPGLRFEASGMIAHDAVVASLLTRSGESRGTVEGLPLEITAPLTGYDLLRIEDGRVIERWTSQAFPASPRVEAVASLDPLAPAISPRTPVLERLTIEQFAAYEVESHGGTIVLVESGNVSVHVAASQAATFGASSPSTLAAGQSLAIPAHTPFRLANSDLASVSILALTIPPFDPDDSRNDDPAYSARPDTPPPGVSRTLLMNGMTIVPGDHPSIVTMIRMAMPAGTAVANHIAESAMLLVIEGAIEATIQAGTAALMTSQESALNQSGTLILPAGEGIAAPAGAELTWRTAVLDPATAVLVTISPIDERD